MKKKLLLITTIVLLLTSVVFAQSPIAVIFNGRQLNLSTPAIIENGTTLVPLRNIFEAFGSAPTWDAKTKVVVAEKDGQKIWLQIDNKKAKVGTKEVDLSVPAKVVNGNTLVPLRFIAESFGVTPEWNGTARTITISSKDQTTNKVVRVVDGDTIVVNVNGKDERLRLIGVDTPETVHPTLGEQPFGKDASNFTKAKLEGKDVKLEFDAQERDMYGRLLAYVWIDGKMFNKTLLEEGYAKVSTFPPNVRYVDDFVKIQRQAADQHKGLWSVEENRKELAPTSVNINTATKEELMFIIHIDEVRAEELIKKRPFKSVDELTKINGIATKRLKDIKNQGIATVK